MLSFLIYKEINSLELIRELEVILFIKKKISNFFIIFFV